MPQTTPDRPSAENGILLHIGPHKTGTSALQSSLRASATAVEQQGALMPDPVLLYRGATSLTRLERGSLEPGVKPPTRQWDKLDAWVRKREDRRLVLSSEWFDDCTPEMIATLRDSWGADRIHVLITVRPLERIMPSTFQQAIKTGAEYTYHEWLRPVLVGPSAPPNRRSARFWYRQDHAALVERWAGVLGKDRISVLVSDERQPDLLLRGAEELIGLSKGSLVPGASSNRSLTLPELTAVWAMYRAVLPADTARQKHQWLQRGAVRHLVESRVPPADEPRLRTPAEQAERIRELSGDIRERLVASGVSIAGDVAGLVSDAPLPDGPVPDAPLLSGSSLIDPEIAALLVAGLYRAAADSVAKWREEASATSDDEPDDGEGP